MRLSASFGTNFSECMRGSFSILEYILFQSSLKGASHLLGRPGKRRIAAICRRTCRSSRARASFKATIVRIPRLRVFRCWSTS